MSGSPPDLNCLRGPAIAVLVSVGLLSAIGCDGSRHENNSQVRNTPVLHGKPSSPSHELAQVASRLTNQFEAKNCREFIDAFPNSNRELDQLYGYDDEKGEYILHAHLENHMSFFFSCSGVADSERLRKAIRVGIGASWDADAMSEFADLTFELVKRHPDQTKQILDGLPDDEASSFWYFLFDGPHPNDKENINKFDSLRDLLGDESRQSKLLSVEFQKLRTSKDH